MKKSFVFILLIVSLSFFSFTSCVLSEKDDITDITYIDFGDPISENKGGLTYEQFTQNTDNPFLQMYLPEGKTLSSLFASQEQADQFSLFVCFNMAGVSMQSLPLIPGLATKEGSIESFVNTAKNDKCYYNVYGLTLRIKEAKKTSDGYFIRYEVFANKTSEEPFYQIDFYYDAKDKMFSYRGLMYITSGNIAIRYFQLNDVPVKANSFIANSANNYRVDVLDFCPSGSDVSSSTPFSEYIFSTWSVATNFTNKLVASTGLNPGFTNANDEVSNQLNGTVFTEAMWDALDDIYQDYKDGTWYTRDTGMIPDSTARILPSDLWNLDTVKTFVSSYYNWNKKSQGAKISFNDSSFNTIEDFDKGNLISILETTESKGIYYPSIYSLPNGNNQKGKGAILDPKDYETVTAASFESEANVNAYRTNFSQFTGYSDVFKDFVVNHLTNCGIKNAEGTYNSMYNPE